MRPTPLFSPLPAKKAIADAEADSSASPGSAGAGEKSANAGAENAGRGAESGNGGAFFVYPMSGKRFAWRFFAGVGAERARGSGVRGSESAEKKFENRVAGVARRGIENEHEVVGSQSRPANRLDPSSHAVGLGPP